MKQLALLIALLLVSSTVSAAPPTASMSFTDGLIPDDITIDLATTATNVVITDNESTNETNAVCFIAGGDIDGSTSIGLESDGDFTYDPDTGTVTATVFNGSLAASNLTGTIAASDISLTGPISGAMRSETSTVNDDSFTVASATCYGGKVLNGDADALEINLPAAVADMSLLVMDNAGGAITLDPNGTDTLVYQGTSAAAGEALISSGTKHDYLTLVVNTANEWIVVGHDTNGWTEASP